VGTDLQRIVGSRPCILTEGAVIERLRRDPSVVLDPHVLHAGLMYDAPAREALARVYQGYLEVGAAYGLPMFVLTPTWRASLARLECAGFGRSVDVNGDCTRFLRRLVEGYGTYADQVSVGGLMGCAGDAYVAAEALPEGEAHTLHTFQAQALARSGVDFLIASTLPAFSEALGMARAMAESGLPYVLSFVVRPDGTLLDATGLHEAVERIDAVVSPPPLFYMANCVHPTILAQALGSSVAVNPRIAERVIGLQANTSTRPPDELDGLAHLESEDPDVFADAMIALRQAWGTRVLGGCCGTDERHIRSIAMRIATKKDQPDAYPGLDCC
jgi:homocysteine S-methyltransferase